MKSEAQILNPFRLKSPEENEDKEHFRGWMPVDDEPEVENDDTGRVSIDETESVFEALLNEAKKKKRKKKRKSKKKKQTPFRWLGYGGMFYSDGGGEGCDGGGGE